MDLDVILTILLIIDIVLMLFASILGIFYVFMTILEDYF